MLEVRGLTYNASGGGSEEDPGTREIVRGIDFLFETGRFYVITGPNGGGKTTLARLITGILAPSSGSVLLDGEDVTSLSLTARARKGIAYGFQHPARFKGMTFRELLSLAAGTDREEDLVSLLGRVGLCSLQCLDQEVGSRLSGGEIKKIELATVIARSPRLSIFDEPDTGIDLWTVGPMVDLLKREQENRETTTIVISHNERFLEAADEILLLRGGRIERHGELAHIRPLLTDRDFCDWLPICRGESDARCR